MKQYKQTVHILGKKHIFYCVFLPLSILYESRLDIVRWCNEYSITYRILDKNNQGFTFGFEKEEDAIAFKLQWYG